MKIYLDDLRISLFLGCYDWEQRSRSECAVRLWYEVDDLDFYDLDSTVDYDKVVSAIGNLCSKNRYDLIENVASDILDLLRNFDVVRSAGVLLSKRLEGSGGGICCSAERVFGRKAGVWGFTRGLVCPWMR